jgi:hypothetical protein
LQALARRVTTAVLTLALLGAPAAVVAAHSASHAEPSPTVGANPECPRSAETAVVRTTRLPARPGRLLLVKNDLWVLLASANPAGRGRLARIDARTAALERVYRLPVDPAALAYGFGSIWITGETARGRYRFPLVRIDPRSGRVVSVIRGQNLFGTAVAVTSDAVWVGGNDVYPRGKPDDTLMRWVFEVDPRTNRVVRSLRFAATTAIALAGERRVLWVTGWGAVLSVSPPRRVLVARRFHGSGWSLALTPASVWVAQPFFGDRKTPERQRRQRPAQRLLRISKASHATEVLELGGQPGAVSAAAGDVWVSAHAGRTSWLGYVRDGRGPLTVTRVATDPPLTSVASLAAFSGGVWVSDYRGSKVGKVCRPTAR